MNNRLFYIILGAVAVLSLLFWINLFQGKEVESPSLDQDVSMELTMYHAEGCDCCVKWADYLVDRGFRVVQEKVPNLQAVKQTQDRKSTRLNSSHVAISYAVFCLKKKTKNDTAPK